MTKSFRWILALALLAVVCVTAAQVRMVPHRRIRAAAVFWPTNLSGCTLWLAADQSELSSYNNGDSVSTWYDHSGKRYDVTAGTAPIFTNNAINSKPALITAAASRLNSASLAITNFVQTNLFTIFYAAALQPGADSQYLWYWYDTTINAFRFRYTSGNISCAHASTSGEGLSTASFSTMTNDQFRLYEFAKDGTANFYIYTNGVELLNDTSVNASLLSTGNAQTMRIPGTEIGAMVGKVLEIVFYNRLLDSGERVQVRNYFTAKYGSFPW